MNSPSDWEYLEEGGANIVFRYNGHNPKFKKMVMRVRKNIQTLDNDLIHLLPEYHNFIYRCLNCDENQSNIQFIRVSKQFLEDLNVISFSERPHHRRSKAEIDSSFTDVLILPDLLLESFSCEIKPKWSGLKHYHWVSGICSCRYCLAQISKGRRAEPNNSNIYCPKLLFSNEESKISTSLYDLFVNPSNQLRLFVGASRILNENLSQFSAEVIPIITKIISFDPFFQTFIEFQSLLLDGIALDEIELQGVNNQLYKSDIKKLTQKEKKNLDLIPEYLRILIAMSMRDSSFIISFSAIESEALRKIIEVGNKVYYYKIDVIDLDIKPVEKLKKYISEIMIHG